MVSGESAASTGNTVDFLQWDIFMICLPMFPPFIIEQNASARKGKKKKINCPQQLIQLQKCWNSYLNTSHILYAIHHSFQNLKSESKIKAMKTKTKMKCAICKGAYTVNHTVNHTASPFPLYLDSTWFNPLAELTQGSVCFAHVV